ncbi:FCD domain-containing protein [Sulfitobacter albidus]|uniref:FCD domain-containing protein n=1 Tax=Sulfitobacter albidus TaxID=2829501 RepID=A0A975JHF2_9RHOB|nr:FCD domain-containing protein [Sulfitobacter albidus]QUJ78251.1 FCD domain-containing protein [Sulfitobacter albidus]
MEEFGVSRTVVREALRVLTTRGYIEHAPRHRPRVRTPGYGTAMAALEGVVGHLMARPDGMRELFEGRILVEVIAAREAAVRAEKADLALLHDALDANGAATSNSELFYETDVAFHRALFQAAGNAILPAVQDAYTAWLAPHWRKMPRLPDRNAANHADHRAILDGVMMRDPDATEVAMRQHLDRAWAQVRMTFSDPPA